MNTIKSLIIVLSAPVIIMTCFSHNVIKSKEVSRKPAIEYFKPYHFNMSLVAQINKR